MSLLFWSLGGPCGILPGACFGSGSGLDNVDALLPCVQEKTTSVYIPLTELLRSFVFA